MTAGLILGIDVGNSKTHLAVADTSGRVIAAADGPGVLRGNGDPASLLRWTRERLLQAGLRGDVRFSAAAFAVAGLDRPFQDAAYEAEVRSAEVADRLSVVNDVFALLRTDPLGGDGVAVVCGAGINAVGVRGGERVRFHSFGETSGDWGGGLDVGRAALFEACRGEDGRRPPTRLSRTIADHFGHASALEVSEAVAFGSLDSMRLIEVTPAVFRLADEGDPAAQTIVDRLADEVVLFAQATRQRLAWPDDETMPVLLGGGILHARPPRLLENIRTALHGGLPFDVHVASVPPIVGAVLLAHDLLPAPTAVPSDLPTMAEEFSALLDS